jgi:hypothetical protein
MGENKILVGNPLRKRSLGRPIRRLKDNIKMDIMEIDCEDRRCMELTQIMFIGDGFCYGSVTVKKET